MNLDSGSHSNVTLFLLAVLHQPCFYFAVKSHDQAILMPLRPLSCVSAEEEAAAAVSLLLI
jgi:hypothetical protein